LRASWPSPDQGETGLKHRAPSRLAQEKLTLRARGNLDIDVFADLWVASWQEAMPSIDFAARRAWFCAHVPALEAKGAITICAFDPAEKLAGFAVLDRGNGYIDQLVVAPFAKGSGAACHLLDEARKICPEGLYLDVNVDNPRAMKFYLREGFVRIGEGVAPRSGLKTWRMAWPSRSSEGE
jgi:putative acetyltransferase